MDDNVKDEFEKISPFLSDKLKDRKGGFKTPEGYFDKLTDDILSNIQEEKDGKRATVRGIASQPVGKSRSSSPFRWMAVAASLLLLVTAGFWFMNNSHTTADPLAEMERLNEEEVLQLLDENIDELQLEDLFETGIISSSDIDYQDARNLSEEEADKHLEYILADITEDI